MSFVKIHLTISTLKSYILRRCLKVCKYGKSRNSCSKAFHNLDVATWKDLLPSMTLVLNVGDARKIPPDNLKLYAPRDFKENNVWLCLNANNKILK